MATNKTPKAKTSFTCDVDIQDVLFQMCELDERKASFILEKLITKEGELRGLKPRPEYLRPPKPSTS